MSVAFAQQGTVDWTSLGRMQFSASIAVLSRLSSAGIESLTLAFGQAMCTRIPLGAHGEKVLMESLTKLKAFSSFGDLVWFGVGVRHVLRDIVQTSEGASLIALCAALSETYSSNVAALILYEMAKELKGSSELSPSLAQWEALIKTSACVFMETTFSRRVETFLNLAGFSGKSFGDDAAFCRYNPGHPQDISRSIIALGDIMRRAVEQVTIQGGPAISWLATYASLILGLRVEVTMDGAPFFTNYDERQATAQVCLVADNSTQSHKSLYQVGTMFTVRNGREFIQQVFNGFGDTTFGMDQDHFLGGTVPWDTVITDTFGLAGETLLNQLQTNGLNESVPSGNLNHRAPFRAYYEASILLFANRVSNGDDGYTVSDYVNAAADSLPELSRFELGGSLASLVNVKKQTRAFCAACDDLEYACGCRRCFPEDRFVSTGNWIGAKPMCLVDIANTIIFLTYVMERCQMNSPLKPKRCGVHGLYLMMGKRRRELAFLKKDENADKYWFDEMFRASTVALFSSYVTLFTGTQCLDGHYGLPRSTYTSAHSASGIYCYFSSLAGLSMDLNQASRVHVGSGTIECRSKYHAWIYDRNIEVTAGMDFYPAQEISRIEGLATINADLSSPSLSLEAVVEDAFKLVFYYRISSPAGRVLISPAYFVLHNLSRMAEVKKMARVFDPSKEQLEHAVNGRTYGLAHGEGTLPKSEKGIILRPLRSNVLAQCVAASWHPERTVYVIRDEELKRVIAWYAMTEENFNTDIGPPLCCIILG
ncbi:hypothetical protein BJY01DRAFT_245563 [Aspergillus pseudoustus]|uniref:Uncharacterized protein n=1 Tax=Aspergillus pseudoustus TaxID=1810923 RepID=A0ABR4KD86_9EURO